MRSFHATIILIAMLTMLLVACGRAPSLSEGTTNTPGLVDSAVRPSSQDMETSGPSQDAMSLSDPQPVLCSLSQSGGIAGIVETLVVTENGEVTLTGNLPTASSTVGQASQAQLAALRAAIDSEAWQQLPSEIGEPVPDGFTYEVRCGNKTVTTYDGAEDPVALSAVLEQLRALRQAVSDQ